MTRTTTRKQLCAYVSMLAMAANAVAPAAFAGPPLGQNDLHTATPIKHVIVIIGENRTFDHLFATYQPKNGESIDNLMSKGIVNADGTPGLNFFKAKQMQASDTTTYSNSPTQTGPFTTLPPPNTNYTPSAPSTTAPPFTTVSIAAQYDYGLPTRDLVRLTTGASGLPIQVVDTRIANAYALPDGPFQLTPGVPYDAYANSPVHRFYQMWQQADCSAASATPRNPSGCMNDLFPWVEITVGAGTTGHPPVSGVNDERTHEGATAMGFYNVQAGDMPYFKELADRYSISDNYHQAIMGGTGANHVAIGTADAIWYSDGNGNALTPPVNEIENPDPQAGTNNWYTQDGYSGGTYSNCSDSTQPGVASVEAYLASLPTKINPNCDPGHYYLLNNYNPGYYGNGTVDTVDTFTIPPSSVRNIGDELLEKQVSWHYYGEGWNLYSANPTSPANVYCNICNFFQYSTSIMTNAAVRESNLKDTTDLYNDIHDGVLPAVSFVKPGGLNDGHPESSKFSIFEAFVKKIVTEVKAKPSLWADTAILITTDEGGGYYDSGYIQPVDFFGDGTRIPLIVVSPYATGGHVVHTYYDHASIAKFIEANWGMSPLTSRSRDNLPNPVTTAGNPYVPTNSPAIGDLMEMFHF